jgi:hypothetical protein
VVCSLMCRGAVLDYTSLEDFEVRALFPLQKKYARRKHNARATKKLFDRYQHLQVHGIRFGVYLYFSKKIKYCKGKKVAGYKLIVKKVNNHAYNPIGSGLSISSDSSSSTGTFGSTVPEAIQEEERTEEVVPEEVQETVETGVEVNIGIEQGTRPTIHRYDAREIGELVLYELETQYNQVPVPSFIDINLHFDTALLEINRDSEEEESGYGTQPGYTGYESEGSDGSEPLGSAAPAA